MTKPTGRPTGVRLTKRQQDKARSAIKTAHIIRRLQQHMDGEVELTASQIRSAEILLNKSLANLQATEVTSYQGDSNKQADSMSDQELAEAIEQARGKVAKLNKG